MNPLHPPTSAYFPQGRGEHIQNLLLPRLVSFKFLFCLNTDRTGRINNIRACARGIVEGEVIFA